MNFFSTKSFRTLKRKSKVNALQFKHSSKKDEGETATTFGDRVISIKMAKTDKDRGNFVTVISIIDLVHHVDRQILLGEINNTSLKWSNYL